MSRLIDQFQYNVGRSPWHEGISSLPETAPAEYPIRYIAYYLPQFHRIPENDQWWGAGFTEWTNVTKALPRYKGHYQPRLPADLGFYDLSDYAVLKQQTHLAKVGGVFGFCFHNYWFSGRSILEKPLELLLQHPEIDIQFCLNWANESWSRRWDGSENEVLLKQEYRAGDEQHYVASIAAAVRDPRYIRISGRPLVMIYRPGVIPDAAATVAQWRLEFEKLGLGNPFIVMPQAFGAEDPRKYGMDAVAGFPPHGAWDLPNHRGRLDLLDKRYKGHAASYDALADHMAEKHPTEFNLFPGVCPSWDNEARRPNRGVSFYGSTPRRYGEWLKSASESVAGAADPEERIVFINAWNEWAEGAYLEPDRHFGFAYLAETRRVFDSFAFKQNLSVAPSPRVSRRFLAKASLWNFLINLPRRALGRLPRR